ncbi:methionine/alanine import family NSS transporter small subunit [Streptomyces alkaliphilus]|uniref:Methionine/alanine import family NSS transporter small subunit n=1 Tax=Streptomyces alkaliphilus TaxID=1472722 RepID=A0A7W3TFA9_9ACTN|nr:methionine/alanine import family NSS transporter small subunit [Streptomyces alkaliphilus]MBB0245615.1 methionine/alanine import family NSS transporter small subunit [Streptomyces alkaliphilus]
MSTGAVVMMIVSIGLVWGGLIAAIILLRRHPDPGSGPEADLHPEAPPGTGPPGRPGR